MDNDGNFIWITIILILVGIVIVSSMSDPRYKERGSMTYKDRVAIKEASKLDMYKEVRNGN